MLEAVFKCKHLLHRGFRYAVEEIFQLRTYNILGKVFVSFQKGFLEEIRISDN